ncbi:MAG: NUDIX hydrolase [Bacteroidota bacterium]
MSKVKSAATIMLARDTEEGIEVLLLKRNKALNFAAGLWVFPGGKIEPIEIAQGKDEIEAAKLAAVRETKEEANIDISSNELLFFTHWTTPEVEPRRYATWFFFGDVSGQALEVKVDDSEIKRHLWINPQRALDKVQAGELAMMPPTYISLQRIRKCQTVAEAIQILSVLDPIYILPVLRIINGKMVCLYEGDAGYETGDIDKIGARHRLTANIKNGDFYFEYEDCDAIVPVNAGMHL